MFRVNLGGLVVVLVLSIIFLVSGDCVVVNLFINGDEIYFMRNFLDMCNFLYHRG